MARARAVVGGLLLVLIAAPAYAAPPSHSYGPGELLAPLVGLHVPHADYPVTTSHNRIASRREGDAAHSVIFVEAEHLLSGSQVEHLRVRLRIPAW